MNTSPATQQTTTDPWFTLSLGPWPEPTVVERDAADCSVVALPGDDDLELRVWTTVDMAGEDELHVELEWMRLDGSMWGHLQSAVFEGIGESEDLTLIGEQIPTVTADSRERFCSYRLETDRGSFELVVRVWTKHLDDAVVPNAGFEAWLSRLPEF